MDRKADVAVIGGGLAGLAAAAYLARTGRSVVVLEKSGQLGGRARTRTKAGFHFNVGPHALYRGGAASAVLRELGVPFQGRPPDARRALGVTDGELVPLPVDLPSLLRSRLGLAAKWETARLLGRLPRIDAGAANGLSLAAWMSANVRHRAVADLLHAFFRVSTYASDPQRMSAGAALGQLQLALARGVIYLDGGWQTLVDGLAERAREAGAHIVTSAEAAALEHDGRVRGVRLRDGGLWTTPSVVSTLPPPALAALPGLEGTGIARRARTRVPVKAATLDLGLRRLPRPRATVAFGLARPLYFSVHSAVARLAPEGGALVHAMCYLGTEERAPAAVEAELEALVDRMQPGWRDEVVERRFVPDLLVANAMPLASENGLPGRPGADVPERPGLFVAGDWIGPEGQLADASLASARAAAAAVASRSERVAAA
jgi:phytoene dehydrogenase-like protein